MPTSKSVLNISLQGLQKCIFVKAHRKEEYFYEHGVWPDMVIVIPEAAELQYLYNQRVEALPENQKYVQLC